MQLEQRLHASVRQVFHFVDTNDPVFRSVGFFENVQLEILIADLGASDAVPARRFACRRGKLVETPRVGTSVKNTLVADGPSALGNGGRLTSFRVQVSKAIVTHLVHEAVEQRRRALFVDPEFTLRSVVVRLLDVLALLRAAADPHHPQKLVDIWRQPKARQESSRRTVSHLTAETRQLTQVHSSLDSISIQYSVSRKQRRETQNVCTNRRKSSQ